MKVILLCAISLDGKIAKGPFAPVDWTSPEDKKFFRQETKKARVVICGHNTFKAMKKSLPGRLLIVLASSSKEKSIPGILEFTNQSPKRILADLAKRGFQKVIIGGGGKINALFLKNKLLDEIWLSLNPKIFGKGISLFNDEDFDLAVSLTSLKKINRNTLLLKYKVNY